MKQETLDRLHRTELEIMDEVKRICDKHGLTYYLIAGTLLGAVRHGGFIPWDDDMDIAMPRKDFERFGELAPKELGPRFYYQSAKTDPQWVRGYAKLRLNDTIFLERKDQRTDRHQGIFIDIFPFDTGRKLTGLRGKIRSKFNLMVIGHFYIMNGELPNNWVHHVMALLPMGFYRWVARRWTRNKGDHYLNYWGVHTLMREIVPIDKCDPPGEIAFEDRVFSCPRDPDALLSSWYGPNYMQLPPKDKQVTHNPVRLSFDTSGPDAPL
ncbi:MAG: LicD family protein [Clostridia bacterium]|nr:LicD family protein [Clostridia bacterium]